MGIIYRHVSPSGKSYIGQTKYDHWHKRLGNLQPHQAYRGQKFNNAIKKYGWENFEHHILETDLTTAQQLDERESYWISYYDSVNNGYNHLPGVNITQHYEKYVSVKCTLNKEELHELYWTKQLSTVAIAGMFDTTHPVILNIMKSYNIPRRGRESLKARQSDLYTTKTCVMCHQEFSTSSKRAKTCSKKCQARLGHKNKIEKLSHHSSPIPHTEKIFLENKTIIAEKYAENVSIKKIAHSIGMSENTLSKYVKKYNMTR